MECTFRVGQKVVCILAGDKWLVDAPGTGWHSVPNKPVLNGIYTIRAIFPWVYRKPYDEQISVHLREIVNSPVLWQANGFSEVGFPWYLFRPLDERKTDISVFQKLLNQTPLAKGPRVHLTV